MTTDRRPPREELFGYYYLGITPAGTYKFPNAHHVAATYGVSADAVLRWLEEYGLAPNDVSYRMVELSRLSVDLQFDLGNLTLEGIRARVAEALEEFDEAGGGRHPCKDGPIT
ncbi:MAG: hypothetical protein RLY93_03675 [Sumerlaeia bacterium]